MHFTSTRKHTAERRLIYFGLEQFPGSSESTNHGPQQADQEPKPHDSQDRATRRQEARQRTKQEQAEHRQDEQLAERRLQDEIVKADLTQLLDKHTDTLVKLRTAPDAAIRDFKEELREALSLPRNADFLVRPTVDRGNTTIEVYDRQNPLRIYAEFSQPHGSTAVDQLQRDVPLSKHGNIKHALQQVLGLEGELEHRSIGVQQQVPNLRTLANAQTGEAVTTGSPYTRLTLIDQATGLELGTVDYDEQQHVIKNKEINSEHVAIIAYPRLSHFKENLISALKDQGPQQELARRAVLNEMLEVADQHRSLVKQFEGRGLLFVADEEGNNVKIKVIDKQSELEISDLEFDKQLGQVIFGPVLNLKTMRKSLSGTVE